MAKSAVGKRSDNSAKSTAAKTAKSASPTTGKNGNNEDYAVVELAKAEYKARKNIAEANHDLNKADCKVNADGAVERACKSDARAQEKKEKADAKLIHKEETQDINAQTR